MEGIRIVGGDCNGKIERMRVDGAGRTGHRACGRVQLDFVRAHYILSLYALWGAHIIL
jgi:hypothetical protein